MRHRVGDIGARLGIKTTYLNRIVCLILVSRRLEQPTIHIGAQNSPSLPNICGRKKKKKAMPPSPWPPGARAAVSFTMDNLGEAQAARTGAHPPSAPVGQDPAVLAALPRILALLDHARGTRATYFAESWSLPVYPGAVADLARRGHEVAWHGYQHEVWRGLGEEEERDNFARSLAAAKVYGVAYEGFRPPGGDVNGDRTYGLLREHGFKYVSPLGTFGIDAASGIVVLPFEWETVDAFWYMDKFSGVRSEHGVQEAPLGPEDFKGYLLSRLEQVKRDGGYMSILFHPFLQTSEEKFRVLEEVLQHISSDEEIWVAPCNEVAKWVKEHADSFGFK